MAPVPTHLKEGTYTIASKVWSFAFRISELGQDLPPASLSTRGLVAREQQQGLTARALAGLRRLFSKNCYRGKEGRIGNGGGGGGGRAMGESEGNGFVGGVDAPGGRAQACSFKEVMSARTYNSGTCHYPFITKPSPLFTLACHPRAAPAQR